MTTSPPPKPSNAPPREQWPKPKPIRQWTTEEYLQALQEDQDDRRNNTGN